MRTTKLEKEIRRICRRDGEIPFKEFMRLALYHPSFGFYMKEADISDNGPFGTHPEAWSPSYGQAMGKLIEELSTKLKLDHLDLVELGPGYGTFSRDILDYLRNTTLNDKVSSTLVESSPLLIKKQKERLLEHENISWINESAVNFPLTDINGFIISNELPDAFPVDLLLKIDDKPYLVYLTLRGGKLSPVYLEVSDPETREYIEQSNYLSYIEEADLSSNLWEKTPK